MAFTYDVSSDRGRVRMLITDRDEANAIFSDDEIDAFLAMESSSIRLAAAAALETIAASEALVQKRITILDLTTDGPAVAKALMDAAKALRDREKDNDGAAFDIAELVLDQFTYRDRLTNEFLREGS